MAQVCGCRKQRKEERTGEAHVLRRTAETAPLSNRVMSEMGAGNELCLEGLGGVEPPT